MALGTSRNSAARAAALLALALACVPALLLALPVSDAADARSAHTRVRARALLAAAAADELHDGTAAAACDGGACATNATAASAHQDGAVTSDNTTEHAAAPAPPLPPNRTVREPSAPAAADETLSTTEGQVGEPEAHDEQLQTALCLQRLGGEDKHFLRSPETALEKLGLAAVVLLAGAGAAFMAGLVARAYRRGGWEPSKKAALMLGGALLATTDGVTDVLLATEWYRCGHHVWAAIALGCVGLNTLAALVVGSLGGYITGNGDNSSCSERAGAAVTSVLQLGAVHAAVLRVWRGQHVDPGEAQMVLQLKQFEVALEAAPQVFVQGYVLLWLGAERASALSWVSLAVSVAGMSLVLGDVYADTMRRNNYPGAPDDSEGDGGGARWAARALGPLGVVSRALPIALFGCAFGNWLALALLGALAVLVALLRFELRDKGGCEPWFYAVVWSFLFYAAAPLVQLENETSARGEVRIVVWTAAVELALGAAALGAPSPWHAAQPAGLLVGAACLFGVCWLGRLGAAGVLLRAKAARFDERLALL